MIREIIRPQTQSYTINIPAEYLDREVEILVLPVGPEKKVLSHNASIVKKTAGILSKNKIDPVSWQRKIRDEWDSRL